MLNSIKRYFSILHGGPRSVRRVAHRFLADHAGDRDEVRAELQQLVGPGDLASRSAILRSTTHSTPEQEAQAALTY